MMLYKDLMVRAKLITIDLKDLSTCTRRSSGSVPVAEPEGFRDSEGYCWNPSAERRRLEN